MKKSFKRTLAGFIACVMTATTLTACSSGREVVSESADEITGEEEPVTLRFVSWQSNHDEKNQAVADAYHELHPNITVEFEYVGDMNSEDYMTKTDIMLMGGEEMDIVMTPDFAKYSTRAASDSYLPLDPFFEEEGVTADDEYNVLLRVDGELYGIPTEMKYPLVLINKDILDQAGLEVPDIDWTWDDYADYARKMTYGSGADTVYGSYFHSWGSINLYGVQTGRTGNSYFYDDGSLALDDPYLVDFLEYRYNLENVDKASTPLADVKALNMNYRDQFFNGKIGMLPMGTYMLSDIGNEKYEHDFITTFARFPLWKSDDEHYNSATPIVYSIARTSAHPKEAFDFLRFWSTEGVLIKGMFVTNQKGVDRMDSINAIINDFTDMVDTEALAAIMRDEKWVDSFDEFTPVYQTLVDDIVTEETDKYLLGSQSLDETVERMMERGSEVLADYQ